MSTCAVVERPAAELPSAPLLLQRACACGNHAGGDNAAGADDQAGGCRYESEDDPGGDQLLDCRPGDSYDVLVSFRGEIQRDGTPIQSKQWTAIRRAGWRP